MDLIIKPFNLLYCLCWLICILTILLITLFFRKKDEKKKKFFLISFCVVTIIIYFIYKGFLSIDKDFLDLTVPKLDKFNWFNELPLQLCNINMFLIPLGILTNNRQIKGFSFFTAPLGATMALINVENAFCGYSILIPRIWGYFLTHFLIVIAGILLATFNLYRPKIKDCFGISITFVIVAAFAFLNNIILRYTGLSDTANYFFTMNDAGIGILKIFYSWISIPFLYLLPALPILCIYMVFISAIFQIITKIQESKKDDR